MDKERKQRVIHTRVSESLEEELRDRAAALGVSVSNLVRNVLENTLGLVEGVIADSAEVARRAGMRAAAAAAAPPAGTGPVVAWQPAVMAMNAVCGTCNTILLKGSDAAVGITDGPGPRPVLCLACLEEMRHEPSESVDE
jgi:hypothetical protein